MELLMFVRVVNSEERIDSILVHEDMMDVTKTLIEKREDFIR
jgi:hypothetical protein